MTRNELEQRLSELKSEQDKLTAELERLKAEKPEVKPWRAEHNMLYWLIDTINGVNVHTDREDSYDDKRYSCGNYYRTKKLAEQDAKELALRGRVRQLRDALCEGYQFVPHKINYYIIYNRDEEEFQYDFWEVFQPVGGVFFDTREHAQQACDILNHELKTGILKYEVKKMYVQKWYCDHCGKELDDMKDCIDTKIDTPYDLLSTDLCQDCVKKLWEVIGEFCSVQKDIKNDGE